MFGSFKSFSPRKQATAAFIVDDVKVLAKKKHKESVDVEEKESKEADDEGGENDEVVDVFQNTKNRFEEIFSDLQDEVNDAIRIKNESASGLRREKIVKVAKAGRIQFEGILIEEVIPPLLLCDNCEIRYSVAKCNGCHEVFCMRCVELCHPIPHGESKHPHEVVTVHYPAKIRGIEDGDTSSVVIEADFPVPNYYIEEVDLEKAKNIDLTQQNSLTTSSYNPAAFISKQTTPYKDLPLYSVDDKLIFVDPVTKQQAYGRIISDWDQRHGIVAPAVIRGEGSLYMYVVEKIDLVSNIGSLADLLKMLKEKKYVPDFPSFEDTENIPYRLEFAAAREVNKKVKYMKEIQDYGPRRHFKMSEEDEHAKDLEKNGSDINDHESLAESGVTFLDEVNIIDGLSISKVNHPMSPLAKMELVNDDDISVENINNKNESGETTVQISELTQEEQLDRLREQLPGGVASPTSPRDASKRSFFHALLKDNPKYVDSEKKNSNSASTTGKTYFGKSNAKNLNDEPRKIIDNDRALNILVLPESALSRPEEVFNISQSEHSNKNISRNDAILSRCFASVVRRLRKSAFNFWKDNLHHLMNIQQHYAAQKIQSYARRFLHRFTLEIKLEEYQEQCYERWKLLHAKFNYCSRETPYSVTMDHKLYFLTKLDANRYASFLRQMCLKLLKFIERKKMKIMVHYYKLWKGNATGLSESDLKYGHFDMHTMDIDAENGDVDDKAEKGLSHPNPTEENSVSSSQQKVAQELYTSFRKLGNRAVSNDDDVYVNVSTMPLGIGRKKAIPPPVLNEEEKSEEQKDAEKKKSEQKALKGYYEEEDDNGSFDYDGVLPPYMPSLDVELPPSIPVYMPNNAESRLNVNNQRRLTYCSYKAHMEGPTDDSCWAIPGKVAMGMIPWGRASKKTQTGSITALLLGGCDVFISCMEQEEESDMEIRLEIDPIASMLKKAAAGARMAVDEVVRNSKRVHEDMKKKMILIPQLEFKHADYAANKKELTRCKARIKLSNEASIRAQKEFDRLPKSFEWIRVPLKTNQCPSIHQILPILWQLERKLSEGRSIYLYSREGHGRCGLMAGCLMGRLYGFTPQETLIRLQNCHDCAKREEKRPVPVTCPQLNSHRELIRKVLLNSNRPMQGITWRSHDDPETKHDVLHIPKKGQGVGVSYQNMSEVLQKIHVEPFAHVANSELDTATMVREKESVHFEHVLERDTKQKYVTEHGRGEDKVENLLIYELETNPNKTGQMKDIIRSTNLQRQPENGTGGPKRAGNMPLLRERNAL